MRMVIASVAAVLVLLGAGDSGQAMPDDASGDLLDRIEFDADVVLLGDARLGFEQAFPQLVPTNLVIEHRAFVGARRHQYLSLPDAVALDVLAVDLGDRQQARAAVRSPQAVTAREPGVIGTGEARRSVGSFASGYRRVRTISSVGRFLVYVTATGPDSSEARQVELSDKVIVDLGTGPTPLDTATTPPPVDVGRVISDTFVGLVPWYLIATMIVALRDPTLRHRLASLFPRSALRPSQPGVITVSIERRSRLHRWAAPVLAVLWWIGRFYLFIILLAGLAGLVLGNLVVGLALLVMPLAIVAGYRRWQRRSLSAFGQTRYRRLVERLGWPLRLELGATFAMFLGLVLASAFVAEVLQVFAEQFASPEAATLDGGAQIATLFLFLCLVALTLPWRRAQLVVREGLEQVVAEDGRRPVVLLRSFDDDRNPKMRIRARRGRRHGFLDRLSVMRFDRFEEPLAWNLWRYGPVVAAGIPPRQLPSGTVLPPVPGPAGGAVRSVYGADWGERIQRLIDESRLVAVMAGPPRDPNYDSLAWEINRIVASGALSRTVFVLPPLSDREVEQRIIHLGYVLRTTFPHMPQRSGRGQVVLALTVDANLRPTFIVGRYRDDTSYDLAINRAVELLSPLPSDSGAPELLPPPEKAWRTSKWRHGIRFALLSLPAGVALLTAWAFMLASYLEMYQYATDQVDLSVPYSLPGLGAGPPSAGVAATNDYQVAYGFDGDVQIFDLADRDNDQRLDLPEVPTAAAIGDQRVVLASTAENRLTIVDIAAPTDWRTVEVPAPTDVAIGSGRVISISAADGSASITDLRGAAPRRVDLGGTPLAVALTGDDAYVVDGTGHQVAVVDLRSATVSRRFPVCRGPRDLVHQDTAVTVVCELDPQVATYSTEGENVSSTPVGVSPFAIAPLANGVAVIDRGDFKVRLVEPHGVTTLPARQGAAQVASSGSYLLLATPLDERISIYDLDAPGLRESTAA